MILNHMILSHMILLIHAILSSPDFIPLQRGGLAPSVDLYGSLRPLPTDVLSAHAVRCGTAEPYISTHQGVSSISNEDGEWLIVVDHGH